MTTDFRAHFAAHQRVIQESLDKLEPASEAASRTLVEALRNGRKVITFGNGGSSAEASHFAEELMGRFRETRRPFPAICLTSDSGTVTCISNDFGYEAVFERQLEAFVQAGDVAVALTTSGKSENVARGLRTAKERGALTIALTGQAGLAGAEADHIVAVPSADSAYIQEVHLMLIHVWCEAVDRALAG
ncbi:MAG: D-sedoheptulose-7-phosphate isomerase [Thermoanaerobaculia bacterium]